MPRPRPLRSGNPLLSPKHCLPVPVLYIGKQAFLFCSLSNSHTHTRVRMHTHTHRTNTCLQATSCKPSALDPRNTTPAETVGIFPNQYNFLYIVASHRK